MTTTVNLTELTDEELDRLRFDVLAERERRQALASIPEQIDLANRTYLTAEGTTEGDPWRQPTGAHDAYPEGFTVTHDGKTWLSLTPANVWEPGTSGWREEVADGYPAWIAPTGAHDAYSIGDRVSFEGADYESIIDGNTWSPSVYPEGWKLI